jgi:hypothetical protein
MAITILKAAEPRKPQRGHAKALPRPDLNVTGRCRVGHLITVYDLSASSVYAHLKLKLLPQPDGYVAGRPYWRNETIKADLER